MDQSIKNLVRFFAASLLIMLAAAALNFTVDPLQIFRPARLLTAVYSQDSRLQNAGLIRSQTFDTVFIGTSLAIHFRQSDIDRIMGVTSLKLAMSGSSSREQAFVLAAAMARHPKRVIWEVDDWIFHDTPDIDANTYLPADLYRGNVKGIASYLLSGAMAWESVWTVVRSIPPLKPVLAPMANEGLFKFPLSRVDDINTLQPNDDVAAIYKAKRAMAAFRYITDPLRSNYLLDDTDYDMKVRVFERDAVGLISANPGATFDIYLPPYSILQWVALRDTSPETLQSVYAFSALFCRRLTNFPNVRLFDFRSVSEVTHDLNNYSDVIHHSPAIDLKVLDWLAQGKYRVDASAPTEPLDRLKAQVEAYRLGDAER
ncbi:hypothetical protein [Bradyrhizobium sp.]|uniref:hypothetical protein n=1 Tax=Bradyrhizobium sp. TaxID=376 RepID=UPI003C15BF78